MKSQFHLTALILLMLTALATSCTQSTVPTSVQEHAQASPVDAQIDQPQSIPKSTQVSAPQIVIPERIPPVDVTNRIVELEDVYFDTFRPVNRAVPLSDADPALIAQLRDAIPPIHNPQYEPASEATWLSEDDIIIGYTVGDEAWAYPVRILNFHEIVNEHLGGEPVVISFCPLCYTGAVFSRDLTLDDGSQQTVTFGNTSALYENDMVMLDYETGSYWWHVAGQAIVGELAGATLELRPSMTIEWGTWQELHPHTLVLSRDTGFDRNYGRDPFTDIADYLNAGNFAFPVSEAALDDQLPAGAEVLTVKIGSEAVAYPLEVDKQQAIMDVVGDQAVVVFLDPAARSGSPFVPIVDGEMLTFLVTDGKWVDEKTGSSWTLAGEAVAGPLAGKRLELIPAKVTFWFATVASEPEVRVWGR